MKVVTIGKYRFEEVEPLTETYRRFIRKEDHMGNKYYTQDMSEPSHMDCLIQMEGADFIHLSRREKSPIKVSRVKK